MVVRILAGKFSRAERARRRLHIDLEDAALTPQTRQRYYLALRKVVRIVEKCNHLSELDDDLCAWIHSMWRYGEPLLTIGDALSALHYYQPWTRRAIPHSWKLFNIWRRVEVPSRAPPLTWELVNSLAAYALDHGDLELATVLVTAFHCLLRTGEALALTGDDLVLGASSGICRLSNTKSGRRNAANEVISITCPMVLEMLRTLREVRELQGLLHLPLWSKSHAAFRAAFKRLQYKFYIQQFSFRPYSLRRGGATALFQSTGSMDAALLRGRWAAPKVARIYICDGLAHLPSIKLSPETAAMLKRYSL